MVKKGSPEIKMRGSDCIQDLCPFYSCMSCLLAGTEKAAARFLLSLLRFLLTGQMFHLSSHPGGPGSSLWLGHSILDTFLQVLSELTSLLCSHSPGCCWPPVYQGTLLAYIQLSSHQGLIRRACVFGRGCLLPITRQQLSSFGFIRLLSAHLSNLPSSPLDSSLALNCTPYLDIICKHEESAVCHLVEVRDKDIEKFRSQNISW